MRTKTKNVFGEEVPIHKKFLDCDNSWDEYYGMPKYSPKHLNRYKRLVVHFDNDEAIQEFRNRIGDTQITDYSEYIWYPEKRRTDSSKYIYADEQNKEPIFPKYPLYIPSKGRFKKRYTSDALIEMGIKHNIVVEEQEYEEYKKEVDPDFVTLLILDKKYQDEYDTCDDLGNTKSKGPGAARNFAWDHSISQGFKRHWVMDDNIQGFYRSLEDKRIRCVSPALFRAMEDHSDQYDNIYMSGPNYYAFYIENNLGPFALNTRIYSCNLILNDIPFRWRGRYNEDTDLSLRITKSGNCLVQYNAFLQDKIVTQRIKGGNSEEFYSKEGTLPKSKMIENLHPDVAKVVWKFGRWHHTVDYLKFRNNRLKRSSSFKEIPADEYGMKLYTKEEYEKTKLQ